MTPAGLLTGHYGNTSQVPVVDINGSRPKEVQEELVYDLAKNVAAKVGIQEPIPRPAVVCFRDHAGPIYCRPTEGMIDLIDRRYKSRMRCHSARKMP